ncbi:SacI homology domain-containing protein [Blastocladiella britannica]|nr:SacI homology domain-containing protein [Blastocladiella britannica]
MHLSYPAYPNPSRRTARSGHLLTEPLVQTSPPSPGNIGSSPPPPLASCCTLTFRDDYQLTIGTDGSFSTDRHPEYTSNAQRIPFLAFLGVLPVARDIRAVILVVEQEAINYDLSIYRITRVVAHQIGSYLLEATSDSDDEDASAGSTAAASTTAASWAATLSSAAVYSMAGIRGMGSTIKSSIEAATAGESLKDPHRTMRDLAQLLSCGHFYHSERDLTQPLQIGHHERWDWSKLRADMAWNYQLVSWVPEEARLRAMPIIMGHIAYFAADKPEPYRVLLIARRVSTRGGRRYLHRGLDEAGNAANAVEIEQIVTAFSPESVQRSAHLQLRGSVPLLWSQPGLSPKPDIVLMPVPATTHRAAMRNHFAHITTTLGTRRIRVVNLLEFTGRESVLGSAFRETLANLAPSGVSYTEYDFHRETAGRQFENITKLVEMLEGELEQEGTWWTAEPIGRGGAGVGTAVAAVKSPVSSPEGLTSTTEETEAEGQQRKQRTPRGEVDENGVEILQRQVGIVRTNCLDSLDRTNVVQTCIARRVLATQMRRMGIEVTPECEKRHAEAWANLGDALSQCYTGTAALKSDFTRTGKRNVQGAAQDIKKSVERAYRNSVRDSYDQAIMDLLLGRRSWLPPVLHTHLGIQSLFTDPVIATWTGAVTDTSTPSVESPGAAAAITPDTYLILYRHRLRLVPMVSAGPDMAAPPVDLDLRGIVAIRTPMDPLTGATCAQLTLDSSTALRPCLHLAAVIVAPPAGLVPPVVPTAEPAARPGTPLTMSQTTVTPPTTPETAGAEIRRPASTPPSGGTGSPTGGRGRFGGGGMFKRAMSAFSWNSAAASAVAAVSAAGAPPLPGTPTVAAAEPVESPAQVAARVATEAKRAMVAAFVSAVVQTARDECWWEVQQT